LQNFCLEYALPCSPFRLFAGKGKLESGEGASKRATSSRFAEKESRKTGERAARRATPVVDLLFGNPKIAFPIPSNISLTFGSLAGENKKAAENIRFQTARFANRLRSSTNRFENCPARATDIKKGL